MATSLSRLGGLLIRGSQMDAASRLLSTRRQVSKLIHIKIIAMAEVSFMKYHAERVKNNIWKQQKCFNRDTLEQLQIISKKKVKESKGNYFDRTTMKRIRAVKHDEKKVSEFMGELGKSNPTGYLVASRKACDLVTRIPEVKVTVSHGDTIEYLTTLIKERATTDEDYEFVPDVFTLLHKGKEISDMNTVIGEINFDGEPSLQIMDKKEFLASFSLYGEKYLINISPLETVGQLKKKVGSHTGHDSESVYLKYNGNVVPEDDMDACLYTLNLFHVTDVIPEIFVLKH